MSASALVTAVAQSQLAIPVVGSQTATTLDITFDLLTGLLTADHVLPHHGLLTARG